LFCLEITYGKASPSNPLNSSEQLKETMGIKDQCAKNEAKITKEQDVLIYIGMQEWKEKLLTLKPIRGKRLALRILNTAKYLLLCEKAEESKASLRL